MKMTVTFFVENVLSIRTVLNMMISATALAATAINFGIYEKPHKRENLIPNNRKIE